MEDDKKLNIRLFKLRDNTSIRLINSIFHNTDQDTRIKIHKIMLSSLRNVGTWQYMPEMPIGKILDEK